jgi:DNA-binding transcriptional ArsR family regulator
MIFFPRRGRIRRRELEALCWQTDDGHQRPLLLFAKPDQLKHMAQPTTKSPTESPSRWTFLTNHAHVLILLHSDPDMVLREVAVRVGITERAVQRIIQDLEDGGYIRRQKVGRKNHYEVLDKQPLRHPIEAHRDIGDLLALIAQ